MATTLTNGATVLTLPRDMQWEDEFAWTAVQESREYGITGKQMIDRRLKLAGRPITLSGAADAGWTDRATALTLYSWAEQLTPTLSLSYRGTTYSVEFDHMAQSIEVTPVADYSEPIPQDRCWIVLRLITR